MRLIMARAGSAAVLAVLTLSSTAKAQEVRINEELAHYVVNGGDALSLLDDLNRKAIPSPFGEGRYLASAEPYFRWELEPHDPSCRSVGFIVYVDVRYTMPYWEDKERAGRRLQAYWDHFMERLWIHERGHGDIALETAVAVAKAFKSAALGGDCAAALKSTHEIAKPVIKEFEAKQRAYDRETTHGWTQGADFDVDAARRFRPTDEDEKLIEE